jgi:hypothetical protein
MHQQGGARWTDAAVRVETVRERDMGSDKDGRGTCETPTCQRLGTRTQTRRWVRCARPGGCASTYMQVPKWAVFVPGQPPCQRRLCAMYRSCLPMVQVPRYYSITLLHFSCKYRPQEPRAAVPR